MSALVDPAPLLCELGQVERIRDLGRNGPLRASAGTESLFNCLFGRDSIRIALDLLDDFPAVSASTIVELARLQGVGYNPRAEEEPGRILHEYRQPDDPIGQRLAGSWDFPYYGAVDTTPQWVNLLSAHLARYGPVLLPERFVDRFGQEKSLGDCLVAAVNWIKGRMDGLIPGYLWVRRSNPRGIVNQVWQDSFDAYYHADGVLFWPDRPFVPIEVQGYVFDALLAAADIIDGRLLALGLFVSTDELRQRAYDLRTKVLKELWCEKIGSFCLAAEVDVKGVRRPAEVVASNPGHLLASGLLDGNDAAGQRERLISRLVQADMLAGAGIRTKSTSAPRFRAGSYHNGSTWPMDTGVITDGLRRHGRDDLATELEDRIIGGCIRIGGYPEFFRGDEDGSIAVNMYTIDVDENGVINRVEQPPQASQGWTATRAWRILRRRDLAGKGNLS